MQNVFQSNLISFSSPDDYHKTLHIYTHISVLRPLPPAGIIIRTSFHSGVVMSADVPCDYEPIGKWLHMPLGIMLHIVKTLFCKSCSWRHQRSDNSTVSHVRVDSQPPQKHSASPSNVESPGKTYTRFLLSLPMAFFFYNLTYTSFTLWHWKLPYWC